jgi:hypothetical protein
VSATASGRPSKGWSASDSWSSPACTRSPISPRNTA